MRYAVDPTLNVRIMIGQRISVLFICSSFGTCAHQIHTHTYTNRCALMYIIRSFLGHYMCTSNSYTYVHEQMRTYVHYTFFSWTLHVHIKFIHIYIYMNRYSHMYIIRSFLGHYVCIWNAPLQILISIHIFIYSCILAYMYTFIQTYNHEHKCAYILIHWCINSILMYQDK